MRFGLRRRALMVTSAVAAMACFGFGSAYAAEPTFQFDIPAESLGQALSDFSQASSQQIIFSNEVVAGRKTAGLHGRYTSSQALDTLLVGTDLKIEANSNGVLMVRSKNAQAASNEAASSISVESVVVTGTNIRGAVPTSPVLSYSREDIARSGYATVDQFVAALPQNFGGAGANATHSPNAEGRGNQAYGTSLDLRGLGNTSNLVLVDGQRLSAAGYGSFNDISLIPTSAVEAVDVLTDGASAIYGSDAVSGVVNFKLRHDFEGFQTTGSFGIDSAGDAPEEHFGQVAGTRWEGGGILASYDFYHHDPLFAADRNFSGASANQGLTLVPAQQSHSMFVRADQQVGDVALWANLITAYRQSKSLSFSSSSPLLLLSSSAKVWEGSLMAGASYTLSPDWIADVSGGYSRNTENILAQNTSGAPTQLNIGNSSYSLAGKVQGSLLELPAGDLKFVAGAEHDGSSVLELSRRVGATAVTTLGKSRSVTSTFAEVTIPVVGEANRLPGIYSLDLSAAGRFDHYTDFGDSAIPKVGLRYAPIEEVAFRGTYSNSFHSPQLNQLILVHPTQGIFGVVSGTSVAVYSATGNPNLQPETSENFTLGFDGTIPNTNWKAQVTFYGINYSNRIGAAVTNLTLAIQHPEQFVGAVVPHPTADMVQALIAKSDVISNGFPGGVFPTNIDLLIDESTLNIASQQQQGVDFGVSGSWDTAWGAASTSVDGTYITKFQQRLTPGSAVTPLVGHLYEPDNIRLRADIGLQHGEWGGLIRFNYASSYVNDLGNPGPTIPAMTTFDAQVRYQAESSGNWAGMSASLSVRNLFNIGAPRAFDKTNGLGQGYDPTNGDPLGRFVLFQIQKDW